MVGFSCSFPLNTGFNQLQKKNKFGAERMSHPIPRGLGLRLRSVYSRILEVACLHATCACAPAHAQLLARSSRALQNLEVRSGNRFPPKKHSCMTAPWVLLNLENARLQSHAAHASAPKVAFDKCIRTQSWGYFFTRGSAPKTFLDVQPSRPKPQGYQVKQSWLTALMT